MPRIAASSTSGRTALLVRFAASSPRSRQSSSARSSKRRIRGIAGSTGSNAPALAGSTRPRAVTSSTSIAYRSEDVARRSEGYTHRGSTDAEHRPDLARAMGCNREGCVMTPSDSQVPWTDEQWALVRQAVQKEANRSRVAATFLPLYGPLAGDADFVKSEKLNYINTPPSIGSSPGAGSETMSVDEQKTIPLTTLQVRVILHGAQMADPKLTSALEMFRRASNVLARLEDAIVFRGQQGKDKGPPDEAISGLKKIWTVRGGLDSGGLFGKPALAKRAEPVPKSDAAADAEADEKPEAVDRSGEHLVRQVSDKIGKLEGNGRFGPFAVVVGQTLFTDAQTASAALVLPSDRIIPLLGGGPLLRSSTLPSDRGIVVALGAAPVELVVATDVSVGFLQVTTDPLFVFRVFEKIALRIKESDAIERLEHGAPVAK